MLGPYLSQSYNRVVLWIVTKKTRFVMLSMGQFYALWRRGDDDDVTHS